MVGGGGAEGLGGRPSSERRRIESESKGGREMERESVYNFGKHRKRQQREQTFLSWLLPFGLFHISSKTLVSTERREGMAICLLF